MKSNLLLFPAVLIVLLLGVRPTAAQSGIAAEAVVAPPDQDLSVGDPIALTLTVTHPAGFEVIVPELPNTWGDFVVRKQSLPVTVNNDDGTETTSQTIEVSLFAPGTFTTPPLSLAIADPAGQLTEVTALPVSVDIASVLVEGDSALRDIKPQAEIPTFDPAPWIAGATVAGLTGGLLVWNWHGRRARRTEAAQDHRLPHEIALEELDRIEGIGLPESGRLKEYYTLTSDCVRGYVERAYTIPVTDQTTAEIQRSLRTSPVSSETAQALVAFLSDCDLVKFAKYRPDEASARALVTIARQIVRQSAASISDPVRPTSSQQGTVSLPGPEGFSINGAHQSTEIKA